MEPPERRSLLANRLWRISGEIAEQVTAECLERNPWMLERWGERSGPRACRVGRNP